MLELMLPSICGIIWGMNSDAAANSDMDDSGRKRYVAKDGGYFFSAKVCRYYEMSQEREFGPEWYTRDDRPGHTPHDRARKGRTGPDFVREVKDQLAVDDAGLTLRQVQVILSDLRPQRAREEVERALRKDPDITMTREPRVNAAGRIQEQVVLRLASPDRAAAEQ